MTTTTSVPTITLNNGVRDPAARLRRLPDPAARDTVEATLDRARGRLPPHRHRRDVRQREGGRRGHPTSPASTAARSSSPASSTTASTRPTTRCAAFDGTLEPLGFDYLDLFLIHWPLPGDRRLRRDVEGDGGDLPLGRRVRAIGVSNFQPHHLSRLFAADRDRARRSTRSRSIPTSPRTTLRAFDARARDRHRGLVADRPGQGARRPGDRADRRRRWAGARPRSCCAGTSSAATSSSRSP